MVPRRGRVRRQNEHKRKVVVVGESDGLEMHHRRDQQDPVQPDTAFKKMVRKPGRPRRAITFADQKERRWPSLVSAEIHSDKFTDRFDIAVNAEKLARKVRPYCT